MKIACHLLCLCSLVCSINLAFSAENGQDLDAQTSAGDKVILHPNGRWEFIDTHKAEEAKKIANEYPENQVCPPGWQGGLMGIGRCIPPGDKDFNRGSRIGK